MRLSGRVFKVGRYWAVEVPMLGVVTQGRTRKEVFEMIADAIQALANKRAFHVEVFSRGRRILRSRVPSRGGPDGPVTSPVASEAGTYTIGRGRAVRRKVAQQLRQV